MVPAEAFCKGAGAVMTALGLESSLDVTSLKGNCCVGLRFLILGVSLVQGDVTLAEVEGMTFVVGTALVEIDSFGTFGSVASLLLFVGI